MVFEDEDFYEIYKDPETFKTVFTFRNRVTGKVRKKVLDDEDVWKGGITETYPAPSGRASLDPVAVSSSSNKTFYGHTAEEWLKIKAERDELKKFIEEKLDETVKDIKGDKE